LREEVESGQVRLQDMTPPEYAYLGEQAVQETQEKGEA
jgi:hypothetical protein